MAVTIEMDAIGFHPLQPIGIRLHRSMQRQERHIHLETGFLDLGFVHGHILVCCQRQSAKGMGCSSTGVSPSTNTGCPRLDRTKQLLKSKAKRLGIQGLAAIGATDPRRVVETDRQQDRFRLFAP